MTARRRDESTVEDVLGELLGCDPSTITGDGFTMTPLASGGAVVHVTIVKRLGHADAVRLGEAMVRTRHTPT